MKKNICKIHGEINLENAYACKNPNGTIRLRCKVCSNERRVKTYFKYRQKNIDRATQWKKENRQRVRDAVKADRLVNPEKYKKWSKDYKDRNREKVNSLEICRTRGLTIERYREMQEEQNGKCAICNLEETRKSKGSDKITRLCVDHDHETNEVRQLLCHDCNSGLGKFKDSPELLLTAADYLIKHKKIVLFEE